MPWPLACESPVTARSSSVYGTDNLAFLPSVHLVGSGSVQSKVQDLETLAKGVGMNPGVPGRGVHLVRDLPRQPATFSTSARSSSARR